MRMLRANMRGLTVAAVILGASAVAHTFPQHAHAARPKACGVVDLNNKIYGNMYVDMSEYTCTHDVKGLVNGINGYWSSVRVNLYACSAGYGCSVVAQGTSNYSNGVETSPDYYLYSCQTMYTYGWMGSFSGGTDYVNAC